MAFNHVAVYTSLLDAGTDPEALAQVKSFIDQTYDSPETFLQAVSEQTGLTPDVLMEGISDMAFMMDPQQQSPMNKQPVSTRQSPGAAVSSTIEQPMAGSQAGATPKRPVSGQDFNKVQQSVQTSSRLGDSPTRLSGPEMNVAVRDLVSQGMAPAQAVNKAAKALSDKPQMAKGGQVKAPAGALEEEVADDIDVKLSEGEFVIPADVVRFFGLQMFVSMVDAAKQELSRMEDEGYIRSPGDGKNPDDEDKVEELEDLVEEHELQELDDHALMVEEAEEIESDDELEAAEGGFISSDDDSTSRY